MSELSPTEQKVFDSVARHGGSTGVNPDTIAAALPTLDIYDIVERLIDRGVLQRFGGAVRISDAVPPANAEANARRNAPVAMAPPVEEKKRNARPYFAHLDPQKDLTKQVASRIAQYLAAEGDENNRVVYMMMYHSLHGSRYRNWRGRDDLWAEALKYLGRSIRRDHGLIWLDCEPKLVSGLPSPYKPVPKLKPRKRKPQTEWYKDVAARAEANGLTVSEQVASDRQEWTFPLFR